MEKEFGSPLTAYAKRGNVLCINKEFFETEKRKFEKYLTTEEIVEDIYRDARRKIEKWYPSNLDEARKHLSFKRIKLPTL